MANIEPLYWVNFALVLVISIVAFFLKRLVSAVDKVEEEVQELKTRVAVLLDRDREQRLNDYKSSRESFNS